MARKIRMTIDLTPELNDRLEKLTANISSPSKGDTVLDALRVLEALVEKHNAGSAFMEVKDGETFNLNIFVNKPHLVLIKS